MFFMQFYLTCLAHASYLIGSNGEAAVVDPQRDVDIYLQALKEQGLKLKYILETHLHADFVSGHKELAERTGAAIAVGAAAGATFPHISLQEGDDIRIGRVRIRAIETPGHTPESMCFVVTDEDKSSDPWAVLTGDTLFIGDVGRPDLATTHTPPQLAALLYDSLHQKLMALPDNTLVYPAHGAGSLCGRSMRAEKFSTIGTERLTNPALQIQSKEEFVRDLTTNLPVRPEYFLQDAEINRTGAAALEALPPLRGMLPAEARQLLEQAVILLDVRPVEDFARRHIPGSVNIALGGQFASWAGTVLGLSSRPVLIGATAAMLVEARMRLARVGIDEIRGYLEGGVDAWQAAGFPIRHTPQMTVEELHDALEAGRVQVLDVRRAGEWNAGHIDNAVWYPLDDFRSKLPQLDPQAPLAVHCKGGYRSAIACSLLERGGYHNLMNVVGGFDAWLKAELPVGAAV